MVHRHALAHRRLHGGGEEARVLGLQALACGAELRTRMGSKVACKSLETAEELAQKALLLNDSFGGTYGVLGCVQNIKGNAKEAVALRKKCRRSMAPWPATP